jgi:hypothetical protein
VPGARQRSRRSSPPRVHENAPIVGVLPEAPEMLELGSSGLLTLRSPDHPLSVELRRMATVLETAASDLTIS